MTEPTTDSPAEATQTAPPEPAKKRTRKTAPAPAEPPPPADEQPARDDAPVLDSAQLARIQALEAARGLILQRGSGLAASVQVDVMDMHAIATFILTGQDPWPAVRSTSPAAGSSEDEHDEHDDGAGGLTFAGSPAAAQPTSSTDQSGAHA